MKTHTTLRLQTLLLGLCLLSALQCPAQTQPAKLAPVYPGKTWSSADTPEKYGWSPKKLQQARAYSGTIATEAVMIVHKGVILDQWGATTKRLNTHSIRKSFISALYGIAVEAGQISVDDTLEKLGIDDRAPSLTVAEKQATVGDLLKARSGVYHPAAYETASMKKKRPARGAHPRGAFWYYNNWDFNALGGIYEKVAKQNVFDAFRQHIAAPLQMEDFQVPADTKFVNEPESDFPAYVFRMSARDMARFGLLYLRNGKWADKQILPEKWVRESVAAYSKTGGSGGYGYLWWVAVDGRHYPGAKLPDGSYSARGAGGHCILILPEYDLVIVHRVNTDIPNKVTSAQLGKLLKLILDAKMQAPASQGRA
ncbi:CubicO group peptidase (beta-lactamase class C family) [Ereboglobus sp. PH5-10]|uniref:serine hydrolase domain-containing protein n=1 Tax=Ereboglobus sp. PH5-10 TaxID=2940629 RepID=UPI00240750FF|nr:serine hydrolase [Ereboglobus sp. PH5-10]MDF9828151.1 CubicO group peptidase (beta-lactamase class C family) [Ereboglobus sp. PH5-10]